MLFRRVTEHVRDQNWFAVLIDFVIVVVGVFIGIQLGNWNEEQTGRKLETVYLGALVDDIREDISDIDLATNVEATRMSALDELIRRATGEPLPAGFESARGRVEVMDFPPYPESPVFDLSYTLFISNSVPSRRTAYDTIINTGGLGLIRDAKLVQEIQGYYAAVESIRSFENLMQETRTRFTEAQRRKGLSPVDGHTMDELTKHFSGSSDMTTAAKEYWLFTNFHLRLLARHREAADRIATILEKAAP